MSDYYDSVSYTPPPSPAEIQRRQMEAAYNNALRTAQAQYRNELNVIQKKHNEEIDNLNKIISLMDDDIKKTMQDHQKHIIKIQNEFDNQLKNAIADSEKKRERDNTTLNQKIDTVAADVEDLRNKTKETFDATFKSIMKLQNATQDALNKQQEQIQSIVDEVHSDKAKAKILKKKLNKLYKESLLIIKTKNPDKYAPNKLEQIQSKLITIDTMPDDVACSILHNCYHDLLITEFNIEKARSEYKAFHLSAIDRANAVLGCMKEQRETITETDGNNNVVKDDEGNEKKIDFDFWSEKEYSDLEIELEEIIEDIKAGFDDPQYDLSILKKKIQRIEEIDLRQKELTDECIKKIRISNKRKELANKIVNILKKERFHVVEQGYENNDLRNAYFIKLDDKRSKILVVINPINEKDSGVIIKAVDSVLPEPSIIQQMEDLMDRLKPVDLKKNKCNEQDTAVDDAFHNIYDFDVLRHNIPLEIKERAGLIDMRSIQTKRKI